VGGVGGVGGVGVGGVGVGVGVSGKGRKSMLSNVFQRNASKVRQFHPACQAAAQAEVRLACSTLFHTFYPEFDLPSRLGAHGHGTCKVQLLRSIGKWSTGTRTEHSILTAYLDAIKNATHFIYIENQFFVGSTAGEGVVNDIPRALLERILLAHSMGRPFKVTIIIPVHPNGDFASALKSKVVMHYEYATINRGLQSMFSQLRRRAPGNPAQCLSICHMPYAIRHTH
jgi:phosphatidylserine/phosphatidylglycerophosphate/cardiolipin synthase-like enzyme